MKHIIFIFLLALVANVFFLVRPEPILSMPDPIFNMESLGKLDPLTQAAYTSADQVGIVLLEKTTLPMIGATKFAGEINPGETLDQVLRRGRISQHQAFSFIQKLATVFNMRRSRPGDRYNFLIGKDGQILYFTYQQSPIEKYYAIWAGTDWSVAKVQVPVERRRTELVGTVKGSLWESFQNAGANADLIMSFVDLFSWDIDFAHESQRGDEFRLVFEQRFAEGEFVGNGRILAASYKDSEENHHAIYWESGDIKGYYDMKGVNIKKSFLRSPVQYSRISSVFSSARLHPVTHQVKAHLGVDFAAPVGTPVFAVADGTVISAGWAGGGGNQVALRHAQGYETYYLHLSRFASGIRAGARVDQGQTIGYVGSTGLSTGPHLDYRVKKGGTWVNPLREKYKPGTPIPADKMPEFQKWAGDKVKELLAIKPNARQVAGNF